LHADHLFSHYNNRGEGCLLEDIMLEMDRVIRPQVITLIFFDWVYQKFYNEKYLIEMKSWVLGS
jgi:hypothetical protein